MAPIEVVILVLVAGFLIYRLLRPLQQKLERWMRRADRTASGDRIIDVDVEKRKKE